MSRRRTAARRVDTSRVHSVRGNRTALWASALVFLLSIGAVGAAPTPSYPLVDTGQRQCYDDADAINCPTKGTRFYGQDAVVDGAGPSYRDNGDGTVTDRVTGLMWQQTPALYDKSTYAEAVAGAAQLELAGYSDWRLPTIKELYSLIDFRGSGRLAVAYIDTEYFDFRFGEPGLGERTIDGQYWTSTEYVGTTMNGNATVFGVNFADGRIKGYPRDWMTRFVRYVRGGTDYGANDFHDNGDDTVTDGATGLMWQQTDDGHTRNWEEALAYCEGLALAGFEDWILPNAKQLQSIVDYDRAPDATNRNQRGAAIDPIFDVSEEESWFWTGTTLLEAPRQLSEGAHAVYFAFGQAFGTMNGRKMNVHGAGSQRSDPKSGDPADWAGGFGPQGDEIRIYNYARCARETSPVTADLNKPGQLQAEVRSSTRVRLTWMDRSTGETGYEAQGRSAGAGWQTLMVAAADATRATVGGLSPGTKYRFRVRTVSASDSSRWSKVVRATMPVGG